MNKSKFRRGLIAGTSYDHLRGRLDTQEFLEALGIDVAYRLGSQVMCHCPDLAGNHKNGDANPSFGFNEEKLIFNCFVCGGGNLLELVTQMLPDVLTDEDALAFAEQYSDMSITTGEDLTAKVQAILHPEEEKDIMPDYPPEALFQYRKIHPYLYERGLTKEIIVEMQVGFDEEHSGIVIPHYFQGRLRGWQIRHLVEDPKGTYHCQVKSCNFKNEKPVKVPKYKNTSNFPKINTVYGYDRLKEKHVELRDHRDRARREGKLVDLADSVIVVESPMTALRLMSLGYNNVVATFGQFNIEQGMLLLPFRRVIFWPDNDSAGYENAQRCVDSLSRYTPVYITPVVEKIKGDAADVAEDDLQLYLRSAYHYSLFPLYNKGKLATLTDVTNTNIDHGESNVDEKVHTV
jgi:hypothetical protein